MRVWPGILINGVLGLKCGAICLLVLAMTVWRAAGQPPPNGPRSDLTAVTNELQALCTQVQETERGELEILKNHQSPALLSALQSESEFWPFVTDPATPYLDRRAAATQGGLGHGFRT